MSKRSLSSAFSSPTKAARSNSSSSDVNHRNFAQFGRPGTASFPIAEPLHTGAVSAISPGRKLVGSRPIAFANSEANGGYSIRSHSSQSTSTDSDLLVAEKIINDPIHTAIKLDKLSCRIVDTPQYQRLRHLKQLGTCSFVFPSAGHTRFEHSLGVAHLAERVCRTLQGYQPELGITDVDILSVKIAGLCHDLGHGPFSHVFDGVFIRQVYPNGLDNKGTKWRHEDGSVRMFQYLLQANNIVLSHYGLSAQDQLFIEEIIGGERENSRKGRTPDKFYLYDVVNNTRSGLDVDKLDYFQRDMRFSNVTFAANFERFIELGRVIRAVPINSTDAKPFTRHHSGGWVTSQDTSEPTPSMSGGLSSSPASQATRKDKESAGFQLMVCYPQKLVFEAIDMFAVRFRMHKTVYTHKAAKQVEFMITDILQAANDHVKIKGSVTARFPQGLYKISECVFDMEALSNLNDSIIEIIRYDQNPLLAHAKALLKRLESRQLYICLGKSAYSREDMDRGAIKAEAVIAAQICEIAQGLVSGVYDGSREGESGEQGLTLRHESARFVDAHSLQGPPDIDEHYTEMEPCGNSQDSFYSVTMNQNSQGQPEWVELQLHDIIVEKMHIHYGLKAENPVSRMRFFPKHADSDAIGTEIKDRVYQTSMPQVFEEFAIRLFCRTPGKESTARRAFQIWCKEKLSNTPFLSQPAANELHESAVGLDELDVESLVSQV